LDKHTVAGTMPLFRMQVNMTAWMDSPTTLALESQRSYRLLHGMLYVILSFHVLIHVAH